MKKLTIALCCLTLGLVLAGCGMGKVPAQAAITAGEQALAAVKDEAVKYVPDQVAAIEKVLADAKAAFDKGDYTAALTTAKDVPAKVKDLATAIEAKKAELPATWEGLAKAMPAVIAEAKTFVAKAKGADKAALETAKTDVKGLDATWAKAQEAFKAGNLIDAVTTAAGIKDKVEQIKASLAPKVAEKGK
ncbi:MAG TPA: hypothetical protein VMF29_05655 [Candidatus Edwardsbacteria bacterium]|nr:hypothetical protein [Candidatus Edwardsbacteria bacterium]